MARFDGAARGGDRADAGSDFDDPIALGQLGTKGDDHIHGRAGNDTIEGLAGDDVLGGRDGNDVLSGDGGDDVLKGSGGRDELDGGAGNDILYGGTERQELSGDAIDTLNGGSGDDRIFGGWDSDLLTGGQGKDRFTYLAVSDSSLDAPDEIMDFEQGKDKIAFRGDFREFGDLHFIGNAAFSHTPGEVRFEVFDGSNQSVVDVDTDGNGTADFRIRFDGSIIQFQASDFSF